MLAGYGHLLRAAERLRWDEAALDLAPDAEAWRRLARYNRTPLQRLLAGFWVAEHAVADHLQVFEEHAGDPALRACFAAQADDERRHARFFGRVAREVMGIDPEADAPALAARGVVELFDRRLPAMARQLSSGERELSEAVALYHLVLEGVVFNVGQATALALLDRAGTLDATREGLARVQGDERWHVGLGVRCLQDTGVDPRVLDRTLTEAGVAARAWETDAVDPGQVARVVEQHRRRLGQARTGAPAVA
jgi:ribonucleoside-diphosphate reductase beta chain